MVRALRLFALVAAGMVLVYFGVGAILPGKWRVESTQLIGAPPARILPLLQDFATWERWSAVDVALGANSKRMVEGTAGQPGHRLRWLGGQGEAAFTLVRADQGGIAYEYSLRYAEDPQLRPRATGGITLQTVAEGTRVTWHDESTVDSLPLRWFCWFGALQEKVRRDQVGSLGGLEQALAVATLPGEPKK